MGNWQSITLSWGCGIILAFSACASIGQELSSTERELLQQDADRFAYCTANLEFIAANAKLLGRSDDATYVGAIAERWHWAGLSLLTVGLNPDRRQKSGEIFNELKAANTQKFQALRKRNRSGYLKIVSDEWNSKCLPLVEYQKGVFSNLEKRAATHDIEGTQLPLPTPR